VTGLISNPNLLDETTLAQVDDGHRIVLSIASQLRVPVRFLAVDRKFEELLPGTIETPVLPLRRSVRAPWQPMPGSEK
jgi:hypothetical protein